MDKQACHVEWGRLKIKGCPIMTGAAVGSSHLLRVACRTSPCLVHLFEDSNLVTIWRFPADPTFLLFGPSSHEQNVDITAEGSKSSDSSLLVITSDGRVWLLDCSNEPESSTGRPTKKKKETVPEELQKAVQEILVDERDSKSLYMGKSSQPENSDIMEDVDINVSQLPGQLVRGGGPIRRAEHKSKDFDETPTCKNPTPIASALVDQNPKWKRVSSGTFPRFDNKLKVKSASQEALLSYVPGTLVAAFGPNDFIATLGVSGALNVVRVSSRDLHRGTSEGSDTANVQCTDKRDSSCLLFASVRSLCKVDEQPEGYVALLEAKVFENLFGKSDIMASPFGIIHGDKKGRVFTSVLSSELALSCTGVLCEFSQPVVAILTVPAINSSGKKDNLKTPDHHGHYLLIIGQLGKVILITGMKEAVAQTDDGPFWPESKTFSWRCKANTSTARLLNERNLEFCEWELSSPITSACMLGPHRLCYCTGSEVFYTDLFDSLDAVQLYPPNLKTKNPTSAQPKNSISLSLLKLSQKLQSSVSYNVVEKWDFKKKLMSHKVPVADVVVTIAGRGVCGAGGSSRPLVALTTRGRLLGVEVSNHVSSRALSIAGVIPKSWRSLQSRMEERIQGLLKVVGELAKSTDLIKSHSASITLALNELANASPVVKEMSSDEMRMRRPDTSLMGEPLQGKLSSFLTVTDCSSVLISPEKLSFGTAKSVPLTSSQSRRVKLGIRLCNQSLRVLSPYWSLLVELHSVNSSQSAHFSFPINRGLGLPVGAQFTHEFIAHLPGKGVGPVIVYLFICHHQNSHHLIVKSQPPVISPTEAFTHTTENELGTRQVDFSSSKLHTNLLSPDPDKTRLVESSRASGAVCILLSKYRVDVLSLLQITPPQTGICSRVHLRIARNHENLDSSSIHDQFLGRFSSKIWLTCVNNTPYTDSKVTARFWRDLYLDDLLQRGSVSKAGEKIFLSAFDSETFSISLKLGNTGGKCSFVEILLESSSLLLGAHVREALMWRLDHCKDAFCLKECLPWQLTKHFNENFLCNSLVTKAGQLDEIMIKSSAGRSQEGTEGVHTQSKRIGLSDMVTELDQRLTVIFDLWEDFLSSPERAQLTSLLNETYTAIEDVMRTYRACHSSN